MNPGCDGPATLGSDLDRTLHDRIACLVDQPSRKCRRGRVEIEIAQAATPGLPRSKSMCPPVFGENCGSALAREPEEGKLTSGI